MYLTTSGAFDAPSRDLLTRLFCSTAKYGEDGPEMADLYFAYGKALLENAISQSSVLGKEQAEDAVRAAAGGTSHL